MPLICGVSYSVKQAAMRYGRCLQHSVEISVGDVIEASLRAHFAHGECVSVLGYGVRGEMPNQPRVEKLVSV